VRALVVAEWRRTIAEMVRYPVESLSAMFTMFLIFAGLFYGARYITNSPIGTGRLTTVVLGYAVWMIMMAATGDMGWSVQNEAQNGTLEQVMLVPWASFWLFLVRALTTLIGSLVPIVVVIVGLILLTHVHFVWTPTAFVPVAMILGTAWGLGLVVASAALVLKRVGQVLQVVQFLLLFIILSPVAALAGWGWHLAAMVVPFAAQVTVLHDVLGGRLPETMQWVEALMNLVVTFVVGGVAFRAADRVARRRGILGHY
jgi:ABC-2 type transport system permease protein